MKWTYDEYIAQPEWLIRSLLWLIIEELKDTARRSQ